MNILSTPKKCSDNLVLSEVPVLCAWRHTTFVYPSLFIKLTKVAVKEVKTFQAMNLKEGLEQEIKTMLYTVP